MQCINCQEETENPKYCSRSCSATHTNKFNPKRRITRICRFEGCDCLVKDYRANFCLEHFEFSNAEKKERLLNSTLKEYRDKARQSGIHPSSTNAAIRNFARSWFRFLTLKPCNNCGYSKHVELCHIKAISSFPDSALMSEVNNINNIIQLCPNCHWEFDNLERNGEEDRT